MVFIRKKTLVNSEIKALPSPGVNAHEMMCRRAERFLRSNGFPVTLGDGFVTSHSFEHAFRQAGYVPETVLRVSDIFSLMNLVGGGMGYSLLPGRVAGFSARVDLLPLDERYASHQTITLLLPRTRERDPNLLALAAECRMYGARRLELPG